MNMFSTIIVAGGKGLRMNSNVPKQFMEIKEKPVLMHTITRFYEFSKTMPIILVLPENHIRFWNDLCKKYSFDVPHTIALGGVNRFFSVKNGLAKVSTKYVAIHDGVRPLIDSETINRCFNQVMEHDGVVPVIDLIDSLREIKEKGESIPLERSKYKLVQTPQVFNTDLLKKSYNQPFSDKFTDDASVFESMGYKVSLTEGNRKNIKITTVEDLDIATIYFQ